MKKFFLIARLVLFYALWAVLAVVLLKEDLYLSLAFHNPESVFGMIFQAIGEWPNSIAILLSSAVLFSLRQSGGGISLSVYSVFYSLCCFAGFFIMIAFAWKHHFGETPNLFITSVISLILALILLWIFSSIPYYNLVKFKKIAIIALCLAISSIVVINILKVLWGRLRFRDMDDPLTQFTQWTVLNPFSGNTSFPSGHTANASSIVLLSLLRSDKRSRFSNIMLSVLPGIYMVVVAFSRIVMGAHFASDTVFAIGIAITLFLIIKQIIEKTEISGYF